MRRKKRLCDKPLPPIGSHHAVEAAIDANARVVITALLAVRSNFLHRFVELVIVRKDRTAVAITAERLGWEK